ncbi:MAG TPA: hypothetical protein PLU15_02630 [Bacillota bacterium]|nr:hypothetical protein [Bacillota bacterium]
MKTKPFLATVLAGLLLTAGALAYAKTTPPKTADAEAEGLTIEGSGSLQAPAAKLVAEVKILKAVDDLGLSKEQVKSLAKLAHNLDDEVTKGIDAIVKQLEIEKNELLAGPAGDAVHRAESEIADEKAAIGKALSDAQKEAVKILSPAQRSKAMKMIQEIEIPKEARKRLMADGPKMLKALSDLLDQKLATM